MRYSNDQLMGVNGLYASINTPDALKGEEVHALPPYSPCPVHVVDEYENCPDNWMHGSDIASSYFVPVQPGKGLWFDFTQNDLHSHHVAVVISVQGINPVTGQKTSALNLEQYKKQCPIHKVDFEYNRFCPECGYEWPAQNYLSTTTRQILWIDGFRGENGRVRQYIITEEEIRGIAAQMIGDDRVFAIGFAFYLSKNPKPSIPVRKADFYTAPLPESALPWYSPAGWGRSGYSGPSSGYSGSSGYPTLPSSININAGSWGVSGPVGATGVQGTTGGCIIKGFPPSNTISPSVRITQEQLQDLKLQILAQNPQCMGVQLNDQTRFPPDDAYSLHQLAAGDGNLNCYYSTQVDENGNEDPESFCPRKRYRKVYKNAESGEDYYVPVRPKKETKLEIGAGAKIGQEIGIDPESIDFWQEESAGMIYVNYVTQEKCDEILAGGKRQHKQDTFLAGLAVGN